MSSKQLKAVIFDIGGVVLKSPFIAIAEYERKLGLPQNYLNTSIVGHGSHGAWQKFERGELGLLDFYEAFGRELSDTTNGNIWYRAYCQRKGLPIPALPANIQVNGRELFGAMMHVSAVYDPYIAHAIQCIRASGRCKIIALTNNFNKVDVPPAEAKFLGWENGAITRELRALFDDFVDSSEVGMRKPEPEFYLLACERNGVHPSEVIMLDDIGIVPLADGFADFSPNRNLKAARKLGMDTIQVHIGETQDAVVQLERKLGITLRVEGPGKRIGEAKL